MLDLSQLQQIVEESRVRNKQSEDELVEHLAKINIRTIPCGDNTFAVSTKDYQKLLDVMSNNFTTSNDQIAPLNSIKFVSSNFI